MTISTGYVTATLFCDSACWWTNQWPNIIWNYSLFSGGPITL